MRTTVTSSDNTVLLALHEAGKSTREIEAIVGLDHSTIAHRLRHLTPRKTTEIYKSLRADIFAEKQRRLLMLNDKGDSKTQRDIATCIGIYYDKERLERGLSSANVSIQHGLSSELQDACTRIIDRISVDKPVEKPVINQIIDILPGNPQDTSK